MGCEQGLQPCPGGVARGHMASFLQCYCRAGWGAAAEPEGAGPGGSHVGGGPGPSALFLGDGGSGRTPVLLLSIGGRGQEQGWAGAGVPLLAHEGEDPAGRAGLVPAGTTPAPGGGRTRPSPLLGLGGDDGLGQEVPVELRLEEPRVGVLREQRGRAAAHPCPPLPTPAQPCPAQPCPHPPSSSACRCASGHRPSRSGGAS